VVHARMMAHSRGEQWRKKRDYQRRLHPGNTTSLKKIHHIHVNHHQCTIFWSGDPMPQCTRSYQHGETKQRCYLDHGPAFVSTLEWQKDPTFARRRERFQAGPASSADAHMQDWRMLSYVYAPGNSSGTTFLFPLHSSIAMRYTLVRASSAGIIER